MTKFNVGDKVRFIGRNEDFNIDVTPGSIYVIDEVNEDGVALFYGDGGGKSRNFISKRTERFFEIVTEPAEETPVEASPTVIELLANISRRLYEAERQLKSQAYEINELYKAVADRD